MSEHNLAPNEGYRVYDPPNIFRNLDIPQI